MSEQTVKDYVFRKGAARRLPVSGTFELTSRCNFRCTMCYIHSEAQEQCNAARELTARQWLSIGREAVDAGMIYLLLTGGEPLLRPDFMEIYTGLMQMGLRISINTNGSLVTPEIVECFRQYPPEKVNISLYGTSEETYGKLCGNSAGYEKTLRGIRMLKEVGIRVTINTTFTRSNAGEMEKIVNFAKTEEFPIRTSAFLFPPVRGGLGLESENLTQEEMGRLGAELDWLTLNEEQKKRRLETAHRCIDPEKGKDAPKGDSCLAGKGSFWITWEGLMYPCGMLSETGAEVLKKGFAEAWKETVSGSENLRVPKTCMECPLHLLCPVCVAVHWTMGTAPGEAPGDLCVRTKAYIRAILEKE